MTPLTCAAARAAIEARRFVGWTGLPDCTPDELVGVAYDDTWGLHQLGSEHQPARTRVLDLAGYYRPIVRARDGKVALFEGMNPELDGGWAALEADLGPPEETHDFVFTTLTMTGGERIHAARGITIYLNPANRFVLYVALYPPTTADVYARTLRPSLAKPRGR